VLAFLARHEWQLLTASAVVRLVIAVFGTAAPWRNARSRRQPGPT
jgi:hypothetical protein